MFEKDEVNNWVNEFEEALNRKIASDKHLELCNKTTQLTPEERLTSYLQLREEHEIIELYKMYFELK